MNAALGFLALTLLGAEAAPKSVYPPAAHPATVTGTVGVMTTPQPAGGLITYQLTLVDIEGVEWREAVYAELQPVVRRGGHTVWTTGREIARRLINEAGAKVVRAPRLSAQPETAAHVSHRNPHRFVSDQVRGSVNQASYTGYSPKVEDLRDGFTATFSGRKLDQGVLTRFVLEETHLSALHTVLLTESRTPKEPGDRATTTKVALQVPEVSAAEVAGEWLVPNDGALLVSLGAHTEADADGKAVVRERLVVLEAAANLDAPETPRRAAWAKPMANRADEPVFPLPALPSRSLPQPRDAHGPIPLPPLPEEPAAPTTLPGSSDPCATPQARPGAQPTPVDPASVKASSRDETSAAPAPRALIENDDVNLPLLLIDDVRFFHDDLLEKACTDLQQATEGLRKVAKLEPSAAGQITSRVCAVPPANVDVMNVRFAPAAPAGAPGGEPRSAHADRPVPAVFAASAPAPARVFRFPLNGAMIEVHVKPREHAKTDAPAASSCCSDCADSGPDGD